MSAAREPQDRLAPERAVYGRNPVREALRGPRRVRRVWGTQKELAALEPAGEPLPELRPADPERLERLSGSHEHQGLVAEADPYAYADAETLLEPPDALVLALDQLQDPQNLGAICRSAEAAGATGVVVPERGAAAVTAAVCRASAGAVEHLAVARVRNLADFLVAAKRRDAWVYGSDAQAASVHTEPDYEGRVVLVLGSEGRGLRPRVRAACDALVAIPMHGRVGSLNVSAAAAILLWEVVRQRAGFGGVSRTA